MVAFQNVSTTSVTYTLFLIFGIGAWLTVNGLFSELPLLVVTAPEGWYVASVLALVIQFANVGPLLYYIRRRAEPGDASDIKHVQLAARATYGVFMLGIISMVALSFCWSTTMTFNGRGHSVPLMSFSFLAALADCTSSLLFWQFAASFRPIHLSALTAGEGLSGMVAVGLAWAQGASNQEPRFSASTYFLLLAVAMLASAAAYHLLRSSGVAQAERVHHVSAAPSAAAESSGVSLQPQLASPAASGTPTSVDMPAAGLLPGSEDPSFRSVGPMASSLGTWGADVKGMLVLQAWLNILQNGVTVSCLPLAAKPYGRETYQIAWTAALFIDPLAAALGYRVQIGSRGLLPIAVSLAALYGYIFALSLESVPPPLLNTGGDWILIGVVAVGRALTSYAKMRANVLIQGPADKDAPDRLMWSGIAMQIGAMIGAVSMYVLINFSSLFRSSH